ncbi:Protein of unknown function [Gryllus bimaculatus]|nr:Protein of unknown function [Gryllus bimaculatus]
MRLEGVAIKVGRGVLRENADMNPSQKLSGPPRKPNEPFRVYTGPERMFGHDGHKGQNHAPEIEVKQHGNNVLFSESGHIQRPVYPLHVELPILVREELGRGLEPAALPQRLAELGVREVEPVVVEGVEGGPEERGLRPAHVAAARLPRAAPAASAAVGLHEQRQQARQALQPGRLPAVVVIGVMLAGEEVAGQAAGRAPAAPPRRRAPPAAVASNEPSPDSRSAPGASSSLSPPPPPPTVRPADSSASLIWRPPSLCMKFCSSPPTAASPPPAPLPCSWSCSSALAASTKGFASSSSSAAAGPVSDTTSTSSTKRITSRLIRSMDPTTPHLLPSTFTHAMSHSRVLRLYTVRACALPRTAGDRERREERAAGSAAPRSPLSSGRALPRVAGLLYEMNSRRVRRAGQRVTVGCPANDLAAPFRCPRVIYLRARALPSSFSFSFFFLSAARRRRRPPATLRRACAPSREDEEGRARAAPQAVFERRQDTLPLGKARSSLRGPGQLALYLDDRHGVE